MKSVLGLCVASTVAIGLSPVAAVGQTPPRTPQEPAQFRVYDPTIRDTVMTRERPDYDALGVRLGGFFLYPSLALTESYISNIRYTETNEESDFRTTISPEVHLRSNWNVHALNFSAGADSFIYASNSDENTIDWNVGADGRLDIDRTANIAGGIEYRRRHEERFSPDQAAAIEPVPYSTFGPNARLTKRFNRLSVQVGGVLTNYDFEDTQGPGGATINMDDRDRWVAEEFVRLGFEINPDVETFVRGSLNQREYDQSTDDAGVNRDSSGWEVVAGLEAGLGGVTTGNIFVGYLSQNFDGTGVPDIEGLSFGGEVVWNPTRLTSVSLLASRTVEETTLSGAAGSLASRGRIDVDHELLRNLILSADAEYRNHDFEGIARNDDILSFGGGATYLMNRYLRLQLRAGHAMRDSDVAGADFDTTVVQLRLVGQY